MEEPLKFCMIGTFYPPYNFGGDGMHIYRLSNELARRGHMVDVYHCEDSYLLLNKAEPKGDFPNHPNVRIHGLRSGKGALSPFLTQQTGYPFLKNKLKAALEKNRYDVIHYHNMSLIGIHALGWGDPDAVKLYTTHEHWLVCPMHVLWKYGREVCRKKSCIRCQLVGRRPPQLWRYTGLLQSQLKHVDCFLSPSRFTIKQHRDAGLDIPMVHMPYFLPAPVENNDPEPAPPSKPYFLFVGRLELIKGVQNLIPVFRRHPEFELLIAGDGEYRAELEAMAGDAANIRFLGRQSQSELRGLYRNATAVIVPSICYETFGIIIIEAFSMKTPAIVNDLGALPEVIEDSGGGIVYRDDKSLEKALVSLAEDDSVRSKLGLSGFEAFNEYWNETAHLGKYLELVAGIRREKAAQRA